MSPEDEADDCMTRGAPCLCCGDPWCLACTPAEATCPPGADCEAARGEDEADET